MNSVDKLKNNVYTEDDLLKYLDSLNLIILYESIACIVRNHIVDKIIIDKLIQLSKLLDDEHKMLGYYKVGHAAMAALLKLGVAHNIVLENNLDDFDKETVMKFFQEDWKN